MKKNATLLFAILLTMLSSCKMTVKQLSKNAANMDSQCPVEISGTGDLVHVLSEDSTLVFVLLLYPTEISESDTINDKTTILRKDSLISRPKDAKNMLGSLIFQSQPSESSPLDRKMLKNREYDALARMGGYLRVDLINEDSTTFMSVLFNSQEISAQSDLCYRRQNMQPSAYEDVLELHKAVNMLSAPTEIGNVETLTSTDYDKESFYLYYEVKDAQLFNNFDEKKTHDTLIKSISRVVGAQNSFIFHSSKINEQGDMIKACAETNRNITYIYSTKSNGKQCKIVITNDELKEILKEGGTSPYPDFTTSKPETN